MDMSKLPRLSRTPTPPPGLAGPGGTAANALPSSEPSPASRLPYCPQCGTKVPPGFRFCGSCGASVTADASGVAVPAPSTEPVPAASPADTSREPAGFGWAEVWFFAVIGLLLCFWGHTFVGYGWATLTGKPYPTGITWGSAGQAYGHESSDPVAYPDLMDFKFPGDHVLSEAGTVALGAALLVVALGRAIGMSRLKAGPTAAATLALIALASATIYNLYVCARLLKVGVTPLISLLLVAVGGFLFFEQLVSLQAYRRDRPHR